MISKVKMVHKTNRINRTNQITYHINHKRNVKVSLRHTLPPLSDVDTIIFVIVIILSPILWFYANCKERELSDKFFYKELELRVKFYIKENDLYYKELELIDKFFYKELEQI